MKHILANCTASISELKKNPTALLKEADGEPVAILNHNVPSAYLIPSDTYEWMMEQLDDARLAQIVAQRASEKEQAVEVTLDEL
ncbi:MAG: antitoxin [Gammaproteobacteria bacterium]|nr:MAG: antitoxin [Gammaproteobacteria bacterium]